MTEKLRMSDADLQKVARNWQAEWMELHDALIGALVRLERERWGAAALRERIRPLERIRLAAIAVASPDGAEESDWLELDFALTKVLPESNPAPSDLGEADDDASPGGREG